MAIPKKVCPGCNIEIDTLNLKDGDKNLKCYACSKCGKLYTVEKITRYDYKKIGQIKMSK